MNDAAKLAQYDDLLETCEALRANEARLIKIIEEWEKRFSVLHWSLTSALRLLPADLPKAQEYGDGAKAQTKHAKRVPKRKDER